MAEKTQNGKTKHPNMFLTEIKGFASILVGLVVLCIFIATQTDIFLTPNNIYNLLRQISSNLYICAAITLVLIGGGIDLSNGNVVALVTIIAAALLAAGVSVFVTILVCLLAGIIVGAVNGLIISRTTITPFIVTLSMSYVLNGAAYVSTNAQSVSIDNYSFINIGTGYLGPVPYPVIYAIVILVAVQILLKRTKLGRHIYAIGGNETAARFSGIDVKNIRLFLYVFSGLMSAVGGIVLAARSYSGNPQYGSGSALDAIAAVVLGGVSMAGGRGSIVGMLIGSLIIGVIGNGLNLMGIHSFYQMIIKGVIIIVAVYADYLRGVKMMKK